MLFRPKFLLCAILSSYLPFAHADQPSKLSDQVKQLTILVNDIKSNLAQSGQGGVYTGTNQIDSQGSLDRITYDTQQLSADINALQATPSKPAIPDLRWLSSEKVKSTKAQSIYDICRAPFLGAYLQNNAMYPGQLTPYGCKISYSGYAFTVSGYDVLTGNPQGLLWIPMTEVQKQMEEQNKNNKPAKGTQLPPNIMPLMAAVVIAKSQQQFNFNIQINGATAVAGGFEGGNPVLICRAKQNNIILIGKLVFFADSNQEMQSACDISVNNKEVPVQNDYELLFWKA